KACAATRSVGLPARPRRSSSRPTVSTVMASASAPSTVMVAATGSPAVPSWRPLRRRSGVQRHSSSRPAGTSKSSTSKEAKTSPLLARPRRLCSDWPSLVITLVIGLTDRTFHLQFNEAVELEGVLHRELLGDGLDEAADDHGH